MFYISVIRSLIDYASPVLVQFNTQQLTCLEVIQNKAMRLILGCAITTKIEVLRRELRLPSIILRVQDITSRTVCRIVCNGTNSLHVMSGILGEQKEKELVSPLGWWCLFLCHAV